MTWFSMSHYKGERKEGTFDSGRSEEKGCCAYVEIISGVRSISCLWIWVVNSDPCVTTRLLVTLQWKH